MKYFCTYFDRNYLIKGLSLIDSLRQHSKSELTVFVVCMDEITRVILTKLNLPDVVLIPIHLIEQGDIKLLGTKSGRTAVEYLWTTTPAIILKVIEMHPEIDLLTYVDADLYFYTAYDSIYRELAEKSVLIHGHRFPEKYKHQEQYGIYNVGLLCFKNDSAGIEVLKWWKERCIEWCYNYVEGTKFGDQGYLNDWPERFPCVAVSENIGLGVAPWNDDQYEFTLSNYTPMVNGVPIIFYHYHSFSIINPYMYVPTKDTAYTPTKDIFQVCVLPYIYSLYLNIDKVKQAFEDFTFGIFTTNFNLSPEHGFLAHNLLNDQLKTLNLKQNHQSLDSNWQLYL